MLKVQSRKGTLDLSNLIKQAAHANVVAISAYRNAQGALSNYFLSIDTDYMVILQEALGIVQGVTVEAVLEQFPEASEELARRGIEEVTQSVRKAMNRLSNQEPDDTYVHLLQGVKLRAFDGHNPKLYVSGMAIPNPNGKLREELEPGEKKSVRSKPLTLIKRWIREQTPLVRWRNFVLDSNFDDIMFVEPIKMEHVR